MSPAVAFGVVGACVASVIAAAAAATYGPWLFVTLPLFVASVLLLVTWFLGVRYEQVQRGPDVFSVYKLTGFYVVLNGVFGLLYYGLNTDSRLRLEYSLSDLGAAAMLTSLCWLCVTIGYFSVRFDGIGRASLRLFARREVVASRLVVVLVVGWAARLDLILTGRYFHVSDDVTTVQSDSTTFIINLVSRLPVIVFFVVVAGLGTRSLLRSPVALILLLAEIAWAVPSGARENILVLLLGLVVVRYYVTGLRIPRSWLVVGLVIGALAFPLIANFREATGTAGLENADRVTSDEVLHGSGEDKSLLASIPDAVLGRFSDSESFATALARGPETLETLPASRFAALSLATLVPRGAWPTKPDPNTYGNEFGRVSGMVSSSDLLTSINVPFALQWWMVGGFLGILVGGLFTGVLLRLVDSLMMIRFGGLVGVAVFAASSVGVATVLATILPANAAGLVKSVVVTLVLGLGVTTSAGRTPARPLSPSTSCTVGPTSTGSAMGAR